MIVSFSGIDGTGKSTQIAMLRWHLERRGLRVKTVWFRPGYSAWLDRSRSIIRWILPGILPPPGRSPSRVRAFSSPRVRRAWIAIALVDTALELGIRVRLLSAAGATVLCDRYVADAVIDLLIRFPELKAHRTRLLRALTRVCAPPDAAIWLDLPVDAAETRLASKDEPFPDPPDRRRERFAAYRDMMHSSSILRVDATGRPRQVHERVVQSLAREGIVSGDR